MTSLRAVVRHVRYWRGAIHKWSTSYEFTGAGAYPDTTDLQNLLTYDDQVCYGAGDPTNGGTYECQLYDTTAGGSAVASYTVFDWDTPGDWVPYSGSAWDAQTYEQVPVAEPALLMEWPGGLSRTGKPVTFRKFYHAIPVPTDVAGSDPDVSATNLASMTIMAARIKDVFAAKGYLLGSPSGRLAGTGYANAFYAAHQMPRGRRLKKVSASGLPLGDIKNIGPVEEA